MRATAQSEGRLKRLGKIIQRHLTDILRDQVRDTHLQHQVISAVDLSADMSVAKVYCQPVFSSVAPSTEQISDQSDATRLAPLQKAATFLRMELGQRVRIRRVPALHFVLDHRLNYIEEVQQILKQVDADAE
ncbi:MAG: 30S ribosome-binding factor RbfA [Gammaproteobacteria bacterium]